MSFLNSSLTNAHGWELHGTWDPTGEKFWIWALSVGADEVIQPERLRPLLVDLELAPLDGSPPHGREGFVPLSILDSCHLLTCDLKTLPAELHFGGTLTYFRQTLKFVLELIAHGLIFPQIVKKKESLVSVWMPAIYLPEQSEKYKLLLAHIPPILALFSANDIQDVLSGFIGAACDSLVRLFVRRFDFTRPQPKSSQATEFAWFESLFSEVPTINAGRSSISKLDEALRQWAAPILQLSSESELKLALRINSPQESSASASWQIELLLFREGNASRMVSMADIWQGRWGFFQTMSVTQEELERISLKELGQAAIVWPPLKKALVENFPTCFAIDTREVYALLKEHATTLESAGVKVILPEWWTRAQNRVGLNLHFTSGVQVPAAKNLLGKEELLDFSWEVSLGEQTLSVGEFNELMKDNLPLVRVKGEWIEIDPHSLGASLEYIKNQKSRLALIEALQLSLGYSKQSQVLPINKVTASGWIGRFLAAEEQDLNIEPDLQGFTGNLRPYQVNGVSWLTLRADLGIGSCLADDMGLGKTVQLLAMLTSLKNRDQSRNLARLPMLIVVPMSIIANWENEVNRFSTTLSVYTHHGSMRESGDAFRRKVGTSDIILTTYNLLGRDEHLFAELELAGIVLDEAQNIKNLETKQTKAAKRLCHSQLARNPFFFRCALTGTPMENRLDELWSIFDFLNPSLLGSIQDFRARYSMPIERHGQKEVAQQLNRYLKPFVLRRLKSDPLVINDLPEKIEITELITLSPEQAALYERTLEDMLPQVEGAIGMHRKGLILSTIVKLKQICNHPGLFLKDNGLIEGRSQKIVRLLELLEEIIAERDSVLLFTQFAQFGHLLKPYLEKALGQEVLFLHGALSKSTREDLVRRFQDPNGPSIFILSLKAGGFGLNLTRANQVIHLDQWWNPAVEEQATDRAYRIGQTRNVQVRKLICRGTLEERISLMLKSKRELAGSIITPSRDSIAQLSVAELRELLELGSGSNVVEFPYEGAK